MIVLLAPPTPFTMYALLGDTRSILSTFLLGGPTGRAAPLTPALPPPNEKRSTLSKVHSVVRRLVSTNNGFLSRLARDSAALKGQEVAEQMKKVGGGEKK